MRSGKCVVASTTRNQRPRSSWPSSIIAVRSAPGELGKIFRLAHECLSGVDDGFLVDRRGHQSVQFAAQATLRAVFQPCHRRIRSDRGSGLQVERQRFGDWIVNEKPPSARCACAIERLQWKLQAKLPVKLLEILRVTYQQVTAFVRARLGRQRLERDFRADAGDVAQ